MTEKEYNKCVELYADQLFRFIVKNLKKADEAKDIIQNTYEILWKQRETVTFQYAKPYLYKVAYHNMIDQLRKTSRVFLVDDFREDEKTTHQHNHDLKEVLEKALDRLSEVQRSLVLLKDYEGYSYEEIGKITGLSASQVKVYLHRARLQLRKYLVSRENVI